MTSEEATMLMFSILIILIIVFVIMNGACTESGMLYNKPL